VNGETRGRVDEQIAPLDSSNGSSSARALGRPSCEAVGGASRASSLVTS